MLHRIKDYTDQDLIEALKCKNFSPEEHIEMLKEQSLRRECKPFQSIFSKRWNGHNYIC